MYFVIILFSIIVFGGAAFGAECKPIQTTLDFYNCALTKHPQYKASSMTHLAAQASRDKATQFPNPTLGVKSIQGQNGGENVGSTELNLSISLTDLLIKRGALSKTGKAQEKSLIIEAQKLEFEAKSSIIKDLFRYRQVIDEMALVLEAIEAFEKIEKQFKSRKARGPEQEVTLNLVELAQGDHQLRKNHLSVEKAEIEGRFKGIFGDSTEIKKEWLPKTKQNWPQVTNSDVSTNTFELRQIEAKKEILEAEKSIINVDSWPKVVVGPTMERSTQGPIQYYSYGFNLTVDIPIFSLNGGARELANQNMLIAQAGHNYAVKKSDLEKDLIIQKYKSAVDSLKKSIGTEELTKKHHRIDNLFKQGLTSGTTIIEAHRQILSFLESQHEHESMALQTLMYIKLLSGKDASEVLK